MTVTTRVLVGMLAVALVIFGCGSRTAAMPTNGDPLKGITIDNGLETTVAIVYEKPDGTTEPIADMAPGGHIVIDQLFVGYDGLCRTGRLVAMAEGSEVDELYLVCKDRTWTVETS